MNRRSEPPKAPEILRDEIVGLGSRSLRKSYFGKLQRHVADLARFRALLDVAGDAIVVARLPELEVVDANRAALASLGAFGEKAEGRPLSSFFSAPAWRRLEPLMRRSWEPGRGLEGLVFRVGGRNGRELEVASREESFGQGRYLILVGRDVTERRRAARALIIAKEEAERVARMRSEFLSIASHELRTPLTTLRLRLGQAVRSDRACAQVGEKLLAPLHRLVAIVDDLLEVARVDRGSVGLKRGRIDLRTVVKDVVSDLPRRTGGRRVELAAGPSVFALADPVRVRQVVANLLENALKFSPPESRIEVRVWCDQAPSTSPSRTTVPESRRRTLIGCSRRSPGSLGRARFQGSVSGCSSRARSPGCTAATSAPETRPAGARPSRCRSRAAPLSHPTDRAVPPRA